MARPNAGIAIEHQVGSVPEVGIIAAISFLPFQQPVNHQLPTILKGRKVDAPCRDHRAAELGEKPRIIAFDVAAAAPKGHQPTLYRRSGVVRWSGFLLVDTYF